MLREKLVWFYPSFSPTQVDELLRLYSYLDEIERDSLDLVQEAKTAHISEYRRRYIEFRRRTLLTRTSIIRKRFLVLFRYSMLTYGGCFIPITLGGENV